MVRRTAVVVAAVCLLVQVAHASDDFAREAGWGSLAALCNMLYMPGKLVYAALGGFTGCLAYAVTVGNEDAAKAVWQPTLGGTYVITPKMLQGDEPLLFSGASYTKD
jgi:hypothetical protein